MKDRQGKVSQHVVKREKSKENASIPFALSLFSFIRSFHSFILASCLLLSGQPTRAAAASRPRVKSSSSRILPRAASISPIVTRFFSPPLTPRSSSLPTNVSRTLNKGTAQRVVVKKKTGNTQQNLLPYFCRPSTCSMLFGSTLINSSRCGRLVDEQSLDGNRNVWCTV